MKSTNLADRRVVLVGQPNVGKSSIFNALSNSHALVSNYTGTTVSVSEFKTDFGIIGDTPGIYSISEHNSDDEKATVQILEKADLIVNIINARTIERDLILTHQLMQMNKDMIVVLNQVDEAEKNGIFIDDVKLSKILGLEVIKTIAKKRIGTSEVMAALESNSAGKSGEKKFKKTEMRQFADAILQEVVIRRNMSPESSIKFALDKILFNPYAAWIVALTILFALFKILGVYVASHGVDVITSYIDTSYTPCVNSAVCRMTQSKLLRDILIGEFGILTMEVKTIFGILLPLIVGYYAIMSILEDSGYFPRLTVLTNNALAKIGLNGKAIIPILLGFGCGTMGILSTRILATQRDRTIATAIIGITIPCAAQQAIIVALLSCVDDYRIWFLYIFIMLGVMFISGKVLDMFLPGKSSELLMDIPPLQMPSFRNCIRKTVFRVIDFTSEMLLMFTIICLLMSCFNQVGLLTLIQECLSPIVQNMLNLPKEFANIFVLGILKKDAASVSLLDFAKIGTANVLTNAQILTSTVVLSLFVPCINALAIIFREQGWKKAAALWVASFFVSILVGSGLVKVLNLLYTT
ncbi:MAG: ferrous iron transporter B [Holosporaceae bacterium]|jgi:ferrous iron transport protein B|nr:ferrous iron transporter B [Holosporaceae bacterium]